MNTVDTILLRCYTPKLFDLYSEPLRQAIENYTPLHVKVVNHCDMDVVRDLCAHLPKGPTVSLDKYLARVLEAQYFQLSRVFYQNGDMKGRLLDGFNPSFATPNAIIVDTDVASGETLKIAMRLHQTNQSFSLMNLKTNEDLIDIEDLTLANSLFCIDDKIVKNNYLINHEVFIKRTSLPGYLYGEFLNILKKERIL